MLCARAAAAVLPPSPPHARADIIVDMFQLVLLVGCLHLLLLNATAAAKQQVQLSDSYLPVAMQVIAHLTDQMAFEAKDEPTTAKPKSTTKPPTLWTKPTSAPNPANAPTKPSNVWVQSTNEFSKPSKPTVGWNKPTTPKPYVLPYNRFGWSMNIGIMQRAQTTPFHRPGLYAPVAPPKPSERGGPNSEFNLPPFDHSTQYTVISPQEKPTEEPLLALHDDEVKPLIEPVVDPGFLPPHFDIDEPLIRSGYEDFNDENLQYLSQNVRDMIRMAHDKDDDRLVDVWEGVRGWNKQEVLPKGKLSSSNLRLLLLYDLLSREAKRQRLSDYSGFSPDVMKTLVESSSGGARAQLSMALSRMVDRKDCDHDYSNNRAKEMVAELAKDESKLSSELRYLQPLVYKF